MGQTEDVAAHIGRWAGAEDHGRAKHDFVVLDVLDHLKKIIFSF